MENLQKLTDEYQSLHVTLESHMKASSQLAAQATENQIVLDELKDLEEDAVVFKAIGPLLKREEKAEAKENVEKRLEFITNEQ